MEVADRSREHVEAALSTLEASYERFPVNQTSVTVPPAEYERIDDRCRSGTARIDVHVRNENGEVLVVDDETGPSVPAVCVDAGEAVTERARETVRETAGVEFAVDGIREATITGVRNERAPTGEPVYRLIASLLGNYVTGTPAADARWTADPPSPALLR